MNVLTNESKKKKIMINIDWAYQTIQWKKGRMMIKRRSVPMKEERKYNNKYWSNVSIQWKKNWMMIEWRIVPMEEEDNNKYWLNVSTDPVKEE